MKLIPNSTLYVTPQKMKGSSSNENKPPIYDPKDPRKEIKGLRKEKSFKQVISIP